MRTIDAPTLDALSLYDAVALRRLSAARARLSTIRSSVARCYRAYERRPADLTAMSPLATDDRTKQTLKANYPALGRTQADVRDALLSAAPRGRCPLCGEREATTLDHYLPRSTYPEFAVLPLNLVPCCRECNVKKLDDVRRNGRAVYLHLYVDVLSEDEQFLFAELAIRNGVPDVKYRVDPPPSLGPPLSGRVVTHFSSLELATLYESMALDEAAVQAQSVEYQLAEGVPIQDIQAGLRREAGYVARVHGANYWRHAALQAYAADYDFCAGACSGWLPA